MAGTRTCDAVHPADDTRAASVVGLRALWGLAPAESVCHQTLLLLMQRPQNRRSPEMARSHVWQRPVAGRVLVP